MQITKEMVTEALRFVLDPEIGVSIVDLGLIYDIEISADSRNVKVFMTLTSQMCPVGPMIIQNAEEAVTMIPAVEQVDIEIVWDPPWDPNEMASDEVKDKLGIW